MKHAALLAVLLVAACARGPDRATVLNGLVGRDETELVRQMGVPSRTFETPGHRFLAYNERSLDYFPGSPFLGGYGFGPGYGYGFGGLGYGFGGFPPEVVDRQCETTFDVVNNRVQSWAARGNACG